MFFPFVFSFYPKAPFYKQWKYLFISTTIPACLFIVWDILFTQHGVWGFNPRYLTGIYFFGLPIEEVLFFFCIPYACVFIYFALNYLIKNDYIFPHHELVSSVLGVLLTVTGVYHINKLYTGTTFILTGMFLAFQIKVLKPNYMGKFYLSFLVMLVPFFLVNGILTGSFIDEAVVWYNNEENLGIRIGTIPVEDVFYGMLLILSNVVIFQKLSER